MLEDILSLLDPERKNRAALKDNVWMEAPGIDPRGPGVYSNTPPQATDPMYRKYNRRRGIMERLYDLEKKKQESLIPMPGRWPDPERGEARRYVAPSVRTNMPMAPRNQPMPPRNSYSIPKEALEEDDRRLHQDRLRSASTDVMDRRLQEQVRRATRDPIEMLIDAYLERQ